MTIQVAQLFSKPSKFISNITKETVKQMSVYSLDYSDY